MTVGGSLIQMLMALACLYLFVNRGQTLSNEMKNARVALMKITFVEKGT